MRSTPDRDSGALILELRLPDQEQSGKEAPQPSGDKASSRPKVDQEQMK